MLVWHWTTSITSGHKSHKHFNSDLYHIICDRQLLQPNHFYIFLHTCFSFWTVDPWIVGGLGGHQPSAQWKTVYYLTVSPPYPGGHNHVFNQPWNVQCCSTYLLKKTTCKWSAQFKPVFCSKINCTYNKAHYTITAESQYLLWAVNSTPQLFFEPLLCATILGTLAASM